MTDDGKAKAVNPPENSEVDQLRKQIEQLGAEKLLLKQEYEFKRLLDVQEANYKMLLGNHKEQVQSEINKRLVALSVVGIGVLAVAWYQTITPIRQKVSERLDREFASDNIKVLISQAAERAAQKQSKQIMDQTIVPATNEALADIRQHRQEVSAIAQQMKQDSKNTITEVHAEVSGEATEQRQALDALQKKYTEDIGQLRGLIDYEEKLKDIELLKSQAINGDAASFFQLANYSSSDKGLVSASSAATLEVKIPYLSGNFVSGIDMWLNNPDGSRGAMNDKIPTTALIYVFLLNQKQDWRWRTRAAQLLSARREALVPPVLLQSMSNDPNLMVRRAALTSFQDLTGFPADDVFAFSAANDWWAKNKDSYLKSLPKTQTSQ